MFRTLLYGDLWSRLEHKVCKLICQFQNANVECKQRHTMYLLHMREFIASLELINMCGCAGFFFVAINMRQRQKKTSLI